MVTLLAFWHIRGKERLVPNVGDPLPGLNCQVSNSSNYLNHVPPSDNLYGIISSEYKLPNQFLEQTTLFSLKIKSNAAHFSSKKRRKNQSNCQLLYCSTNCCSRMLSIGIFNCSVPSAVRFSFTKLWSQNSVSWVRSTTSVLTKKPSRHFLYKILNGMPNAKRETKDKRFRRTFFCHF